MKWLGKQPAQISNHTAGSSTTLGFGSVWLLIIGLVGWCGTCEAQDGAFVQDTMPDGVVMIEAEHYHHRVATATHAWEPTILRSGEVVMKGLPDTGLYQNRDFVGVTPRMDFRVIFDQPGTYYVVVRGFGEASSGDTVHVGLNGAFVETADRIYVSRRALKWSAETIDDINAYIEVPSAGEHTVNVWMREDGFMLDRLLLSRNPDFIPHGVGPIESLRVGETDVVPADPRQAAITGLRMEGDVLVADFVPGPGVEAYLPMVQGDLMAGAGPSSDAATFGYQLLIDPAVGDGARFYSIDTVPVSQERERCGLVLNRLAYGPTPELLARVMGGANPLGADGYIDEQLEPESVVERADSDPDIRALALKLRVQSARIEDLQAWHALRAVRADRQWLEVMTQFVSNHFVTYAWKSRNWLRDEYNMDRDLAEALAANMEYREMEQWRAVLTNPNGTFLDLLTVSAQSPAMNIYLDTVGSEKADPNENYGRELLELFCMGVDNGYKQADIEEIARIWTGWRLTTAHPDDVGEEPVPYVPAVLLPTGSEWLYRKGWSEPASDWMAPDFSATSTNWLSGAAGIGYGDDDDATVLEDMRRNYTTLYFRKAFQVAAADEVNELIVRIFIDDGCIAYLNGNEIGRYNAGEPGANFAFDDVATDGEADGVWITFLVDTSAGGWLREGENVLAVQGLNLNLWSSDFSFDVEVSAGPLPVYRRLYLRSEHDAGDKVIFAGRRVDPRFGAPFAGADYELAVVGRSSRLGQYESTKVLAHLANLPHTMEHISTKLCRLFVHEDFEIGAYYNLSRLSAEAALIQACMQAWNTPGPDGRKGNLRQIMRVIFESELFRSQQAARQKIKTPLEFTVSAIRALRGEAAPGTYTASTDGYDLLRPMRYMGMETFNRAEPNGWPEDGEEWIDSGNMAERMRFVQNFVMPEGHEAKERDAGSDGVDNLCDPMRLVLTHLDGSEQTDEVAVVRFFMALLFPAVGEANLALEREVSLGLMNSDQSGAANSSPFSALAPGSAAYEQRLRSLLGLLLCSPKFHEQ